MLEACRKHWKKNSHFYEALLAPTLAPGTGSHHAAGTACSALPWWAISGTEPSVVPRGYLLALGEVCRLLWFRREAHGMSRCSAVAYRLLGLRQQTPLSHWGYPFFQQRINICWTNRDRSVLSTLKTEIQIPVPNQIQQKLDSACPTSQTCVLITGVWAPWRVEDGWWRSFLFTIRNSILDPRNHSWFKINQLKIRSIQDQSDQFKIRFLIQEIIPQLKLIDLLPQKILVKTLVPVLLPPNLNWKCPVVLLENFICLPEVSCFIHCTSFIASKTAIHWAIPTPHHWFVHFSKQTEAEDWWKSSLQTHNQRLNHSIHNLKVLRSRTVNLLTFTS